MLLILPVSAAVTSGQHTLTCEDRSVTIYYSTSLGGNGSYAGTSSTMEGYLTAATTAVYKDLNDITKDPISVSNSDSNYSTSCSAFACNTDNATAHYTVRSGYSTHSYYATEMRAWSGESEDSILYNNGIDPIEIYYATTSEYVSQ